MLLRKMFRFEASHVLPKHPGKCSRLHGHSWVLHVETQGPVNQDTGFVMDYAEISAVVKPLVEKLDHRHLGAWQNLGKFVTLDGYPESWRVPDLPVDFYPSSENLLFWIGEQLCAAQLKWSKVALEETCTSYCELKLDEFMVWFTNKYGLAAAKVALECWK